MQADYLQHGEEKHPGQRTTSSGQMIQRQLPQENPTWGRDFVSPNEGSVDKEAIDQANLHCSEVGVVLLQVGPKSQKLHPNVRQAQVGYGNRTATDLELQDES